MSEKIVKVTNGKILNYKISASGYKTIYGSKLITADTSISKNMITEESAEGVYSLGDRIGGIASFVCYFNSTNRETNVDTKYAVFVLDAKYRGAYYALASSSIPDFPSYNNSSAALNSTDSATYNTNFALESGITVPAFTFARNAATLTSLNIPSQLPNCYEAVQIWANRAYLDSIDPTLSDYSTNSLERWNCGNDSTSVKAGVWTASAWPVTSSGQVGFNDPYYNNINYQKSVIPVFEIPVE